MFNFLNKIFNKRSGIFFTVFIFIFLFYQTALARNYIYDLIDVKININQDSTFDVEEDQIFNYEGEYHSGWRSVSLNKTDGITDIEVIDGETGQPLVYSWRRLDKLDPASWGKFTYFKEKGNQNIEWYYNLADTTHKWIIKYKVHGGIGFFRDYDELYWNIFTDYEAMIREARVLVSFPDGIDLASVKAGASRDNNKSSYYSITKEIAADKKSVFFKAIYFGSREDFTIQIDCPKGFVSQSAYWQDFFQIYLLYILAALITLVNFIYIIIHWYFREVRPKGRGTIIPQYAPPQNLRPAMAEVLLREKVTDKGWSATVIDLAVRGYIRIKEDTADWLEVFGRIVLVFVLSVALLLLGFAISNNFSAEGVIIGSIIIWIFVVRFTSQAKEFFTLLKEGRLKEILVPKNYILEKAESADESVLEDYEIKFLKVIFRSGKTFSTKAMKRASNSTKRGLYEAMERLKEKLYSETTIDTGAFEIGVEKEKIGAAVFIGIIFAIFIILAGFSRLRIAVNGEIIFLIALLFNAASLYIYLKYEARLNRKGFILKEDWLGFKMYLETAERYRMQNLTPETFEKYLPYAIIFGIEKKWGKAFESMNIQNPSWYSGGYVGGGFHSGGFSGSGGFSPSGFSASFSSSFSSAFSSAGGAGSAGGGGGGGGAGGGGGGGGGGAG